MKDEKSPLGYKGYSIDMIEEMSRRMDFEYNFTLTTGYGWSDNNGNWNGMMKDLIEKRVDIGLGVPWIISSRKRFVDFSIPYYDLVGFRILMKKPIKQTSHFKFLSVFNVEVWIFTFGVFILSSIFIWLYDMFSPYSYRNNKDVYENDDLEENKVFDLRESMWFCMLSWTPQGGGTMPKSESIDIQSEQKKDQKKRCGEDKNNDRKCLFYFLRQESNSYFRH